MFIDVVFCHLLDAVVEISCVLKTFHVFQSREIHEKAKFSSHAVGGIGA
jgi:hypothetical protein